MRKNQFCLLLTGLTIAVFALGCSDTKSNSMLTGSSSSSPTTPNNGTTPATSNYFNIVFDTPNKTTNARLHQSGSWAKDCQFSAADATTNLTCFLEMNEEDLYFNSLKLTWNAPASLCTYVEVTPYWFFKNRPSVSNSTLQYTNVTYSYTNDNGALRNLVQTNPVVNVPADQLVHFHSVGAKNAVYCDYDYSWIAGEKNCCQGVSTATVTTIVTSGGVTTTTVGAPTDSDWGGKWGNCAAGAGADDTNNYGRDFYSNLPLTGVYYALPGISGTFNVKSAIEQHYVSNVHAANYAEGIGALSPMPLWSPTYFFGCYSPSHALIGSLSLYIREWNSHNQISKQDLGDWKAVTSDTGQVEDNKYNSWYDFYQRTTPANPVPGATPFPSIGL